jgi:hypothetical protein
MCFCGAVIVTGRAGPQMASVPQAMVELWRSYRSE